MKRSAHDVRSRGRDLLIHVLAQARTWRKPYRGVMHALMFWGMIVSMAGHVILLLQYPLFTPFVIPFPRDAAYLLFELVMDLAGLALLTGVAMAAYRRYVQRPATLESRWDDAWALAFLALVAAVGYITEAYRIVITSPDWSGWMPAANALAGLLRALHITPAMAAQGHQIILYAHVLLGLAFFASLPFTKMRHLIMGPWHILVKPFRAPGVIPKIENIEETEQLGVETMSEFEPQQLLSFDACMRCGRCTELCPPYLSGLDFNPREVVQRLREGMYEAWVRNRGDAPALHGDLFDATYPWLCTTCGGCWEACPVFINPMGALMDLRRQRMLATGQVPAGVAATSRNIERQGNPWGIPPQQRLDWAEGLDAPIAEPGRPFDVLLWPGCAGAFDARNQRVTRALAKLLHRAGVDYAILGDGEACCGDSSRRLGNEYMWQVHAEQNIALLSEYRFNAIVTPCPHCLHAFANEYPQMGGHYTVIHHSAYLYRLVRKGQLKPQQALDRGTLTYHDPCYLGRYNRVFDEPRALLDAMPGVRRAEMAYHHAESFCCGAGGGGMWLEIEPEHRPGAHRIRQAEAAGAETVCTACPYCLMMLGSASGQAEGAVQVADIAELLAQSVGVDVT